MSNVRHARQMAGKQIDRETGMSKECDMLDGLTRPWDVVYEPNCEIYVRWVAKRWIIRRAGARCDMLDRLI